MLVNKTNNIYFLKLKFSCKGNLSIFAASSLVGRLLLWMKLLLLRKNQLYTDLKKMKNCQYKFNPLYFKKSLVAFSHFPTIKKLRKIKLTLRSTYLLASSNIYRQIYMQTKNHKKLRQREHELIQPQHSAQHTLLKLRTIQHSREKSSSRRTTSHQKQCSDHGTETTYTGTILTQKQRLPIGLPTKQSEKAGVSTRLDQLKAKVDFLMNDRERSLDRSRKLSNSKEKNSPSRYHEPSTNRTHKASSSLENSFLNSYSFCQHNQFTPQRPIDITPSMSVLKLNACRLLENLEIDPQDAQYFSSSNSLEDVFIVLSNTINFEMSSRFKSMEFNLNLQHQQEKQRYKNQLETSLQNQKNLMQKNQYHVQQIQNIHQRTKKLLQKIQEQETQIFKLKSLNTESENTIIRTNLELQNYREYVNNTLLLEYQSKIYKNLNQLGKKDYSITKLKRKLEEAISQREDNSLLKSLANQQLRKWQEAYAKLTERYELEKSQKQTAKEELQSEQNAYMESKQMMINGYLVLVENLNRELTQLRIMKDERQEQIMSLLKQLKQSESRIQETQEDYFSLNHDFTKSVEQWVTKQQHYENTIESLRQQVSEAHQCIAEYSTMLAAATSENLATKAQKKHL